MVPMETQMNEIVKTIREVKDKYDLLNSQVQDSCKNFDELKLYMVS